MEARATIAHPIKRTFDMMDFKPARKALKQGFPVTVTTSRATYLVESVGTCYVHSIAGDRFPLADVLTIGIEEPTMPQAEERSYRLTQGPDGLVIEICKRKRRWEKATQKQCCDVIALELADRGVATQRLQWYGSLLAIDRAGLSHQVFRFPAQFPSASAFAESLDWIAGYYEARDRSVACG